MVDRAEITSGNIQVSNTQKLLTTLISAMRTERDGQHRLDRMVDIVADSMNVDVCSIYLHVDFNTLELCATRGLRSAAIHKTRLKIGEGLVGQVAETAMPVNTARAPEEPNFSYRVETGEERYSSFLGVPIMRPGQTLGVIVVQTRESRSFDDSEVITLEVVATVIAEMRETGIITGEGKALSAPHTLPVTYSGIIAHEGLAEGRVLLHEPHVIITRLVAEDPASELDRLELALQKLRGNVDEILDAEHVTVAMNSEQREVIEIYRMIANSSGWVNRVKADIHAGLSAEAAVDKEQSEVRAKMEASPDAYLRDRLHDLDDLFHRLLRILTGQGRKHEDRLPDDPVLVARNIGPGELLEYGRTLRGIILEEGSIGSHATIVARALAIPLMIHAKGVIAEALDGDSILLDCKQGLAHVRPSESVAAAFRNTLEVAANVAARYTQIRDLPALTRDGVEIRLYINAGLLADLPNLEPSGADGVGLFRTELRFLAANKIPTRRELAEQYSQVLDSAKGRRVVFRTIDIGSDKVVPYLKREDEPNPALGWRAIRICLDKPGILKMQMQSLVRGAKGRPLCVMFPMVAGFGEFKQARSIALGQIERERRMGHVVPEKVEIGAMLETPSLAFAPDGFYELADFVSIGGNDLKQFFFAADRQNERVRSRYNSFYLSYLELIRYITTRCHAIGTPVSYCGEDAGQPRVAACLAAMGVHAFSLRSASLGKVKYLLRQVNLREIAEAIEQARASGEITFEKGIDQFTGVLDPSPEAGPAD